MAAKAAEAADAAEAVAAAVAVVVAAAAAAAAVAVAAAATPPPLWPSLAHRCAPSAPHGLLLLASLPCHWCPRPCACCRHRP